MIGTSDNDPEPTSAMTWRAKKKLAEGYDRHDLS